MNKLEAIKASKTFRQRADELLQDMKAHKKLLTGEGTFSMGASRLLTIEEQKVLPPPEEQPDDRGETIAQHILSIRDLESCIMRQGMALKYIGNPNPYPESYNPASPVVEPTADGLKL